MRSKFWRILRNIGLAFLACLLVIVMFAFRGLGEMKELSIGEINLSSVADGVYTGEFSAYRWTNVVQVTVVDHKITDIKFSQSQDTNLATELVAKILGAQSLQVDAVSGATVTSKTMLKAIENALTGK